MSQGEGIPLIFIAPALADTEALGARIAAFLEPGDTLLLDGQLGAGKTALTRAIVTALGAPDEVSSPTFTLIQEYAGGRATLYHVDLYRLEPAEVDDLGLEDLVLGDGVVAIEWAERWAGRPDDVIEVRLEQAGEDERRIAIRPAPAEH